MKKIALYINNVVLKKRVEAAIQEVQLGEIISVQTRVVSKHYMKTEMEKVNLLIIDLESVQQLSPSIIDYTRELYDASQIPILAISAGQDLVGIRQAINQGCNDVIIKPFENEVLIKKIYVLIKSGGEVTAKNLESGEKSIERLEKSVLDESMMQVYATPLKWSEAFILGFEQIDEEHKSLIEKYAELYANITAGNGKSFAKEVVQYLDQYVTTHFDHEERLHETYKVSGALAHKQLHEKLKQDLKQMMDKYLQEAIDAHDLIKLNLFLRQWLIHHILIEDKAIVDRIRREQKPEV